MEDLTVVIKVKYGDTLRRFNASVVDKKLNFNMNELTEKISHLFKFAPDTGIVLSYIDEDGDLVALVDDDDLLDVVKQSLDPLRITVTLNDKKNGSPFTVSTGTSPSRSPRVQLPFQNSNALGSEILKTIPDPLRETLMQLSTDLASRVSTAAPGIYPGVSELVNYFSKVGLSYLNHLSESQTRLGSSTEIGVPERSVSGPETKDSEFDPEVLNVPLKSRLEKQSSKNNETLRKEMEVKAGGVAGGVAGGRTVASSSKSTGFNYVNGAVSNLKTLDDGLKNNDIFHDSEPTQIKPDFVPASAGKEGPLVPAKGFSPESFTNLVIPSSAKSKSQNDGCETVFHRGVRCDVCRVHPIPGPRFKSKVKVDYDLCSICFAAVGDEKDYIRMDHPAINLHQWSFKGINDHPVRGRYPAFQHVYNGSKMKSGASKLNSCFIQDVNVLDGTVIAPLTPFTKIWRMKNNGKALWPQKTQLVWIGGDKMSDAYSVEVEIPATGFAVGQELDIAVRFISPELPGRYTSYWRMASPSGHKFGQRVWVLIQVEDAFKETHGLGVQGLNLNFPPVNSVLSGPEIANLDLVSPLQDSHPEPETAVMVDPFVQPLQPNNEQEMKFPITDSLLIGRSATNSTLLSPPSNPHPFTDLSGMTSQAFPPPSIPYPIPPPPAVYPWPSVFYPIPPPSTLSPMTSPPPIVNPLATPHIPNTPHPPVGRTQQELQMEDVEKKLLTELDIMGFKHVDLNKDILKLHGYDLEKVVDDLCAVSEWDPLLEELQEMGFHNTEMNKELLKKNNGSIKRVVMDLISEEEMQ